MKETFLEYFFDEILTEIYNRVLEVSTATWCIALASSFVIEAFLSGSHSVVTHVLTGASHADFKVSVAVEVGKLIWVNATFAVEAVNVLTDDAIEYVSVHQLNKGHVSR